MQTIASVARVCWRPNHPTQITSCSLVHDTKVPYTLRARARIPESHFFGKRYVHVHVLEAATMGDAPPLPSPWLVCDTPHQSSLLFAVLFVSVNVLMCARIMALARALQVNVWDLRRHYIPVLSFERHTDTATDMVWADSNVSSLAHHGLHVQCVMGWRRNQQIDKPCAIPDRSRFVVFNPPYCFL